MNRPGCVVLCISFVVDRSLSVYLKIKSAYLKTDLFILKSNLFILKPSQFILKLDSVS